MYKQPKPLFDGQNVQCIFRVSDGSCIPFDPDNTDYQKYLAWVSEGNTVLPADEVSGE